MIIYEFFGYTKITVEQPLKEKGVIVKNIKENVKVDTSKRDYERVPLSTNIQSYFNKEVKPHLPEAWIDYTKNLVGYEINFNKSFYEFIPLRSLEDISKDLNSIDKEILQLTKEIKDE